MSARVSIPALRRAVLDRGLTLRPICPDCREPHRPRDFHASGVCRRCARKAAALRRIEAIDAQLVTLWAASREVTDPATADAIEADMTALEQERYDLYWTEVADPEEFSHAD